MYNNKALQNDKAVLFFILSKKDSKGQESLQSSTTPVPGYQIGN